MSGWRDDGQVLWLDDAHVQQVRGDARLVTERVAVGCGLAVAWRAPNR
jgi:hypothetical protein